MDFFDILNKTVLSIFKAQIIVICIFIGSYLLESMTELKLLFWEFKWKKNLRNANAARDGNAVYYFFTMLAVYIYDCVTNKIDFNVISLIIWFIIALSFAIVFAKIYNKYQGFDPSKANDEFN
jgi:hypothetical protein